MKRLRKVRLLFLPVLVLACFFLISGCQNDQTQKQLQEENTNLKAENTNLKAENQRLKAQIPLTTSPTPSATPAATQSPTPATTGSLVQVSFDDIKGVFGEKEITQLAQLGVFDTTSGKFNPQQPITRAEFVRWLVRANNAIFASDRTKQVRYSEGGEATFSDVPPTHPDFRYIQGMTNAGFTVGYDQKTFQPNQPLTREQMVAIKVGLDKGGLDITKADYYQIQDTWLWTDYKQVSEKYVTAMLSESNNTSENIKRTFGAIKTFKPQAPVSRAEAAVCMWQIGNNRAMNEHNSITAEEALIQDKGKN